GGGGGGAGGGWRGGRGGERATPRTGVRREDSRRARTRPAAVRGRAGVLALHRALRGERPRLAVADRPPRVVAAAARVDERDGGAGGGHRAAQGRHGRDGGEPPRSARGRQTMGPARLFPRGRGARRLRPGA